MRFLISILIVALVVFFLANSCSSDKPKTTSTSQITANQTQQTSSQKSSLDIEAIETLKKYMFENYGGNGNPKFKTSWYDLITDINVEKVGDRKGAVIKTDIYPKEEGKKLAQTIAGAVYFNSLIKLDYVEVLGQNGSLLYYK